jgi:hypothetical protein
LVTLSNGRVIPVVHTRSHIKYCTCVTFCVQILRKCSQSVLKSNIVRVTTSLTHAWQASFDQLTLTSNGLGLDAVFIDDLLPGLDKTIKSLAQKLASLQQDKEALDRRIEEISSYLKSLTDLKTAGALSPEVVSLLQSSEDSTDPQDTHYQRICDYISEHRNIPQTITDISEGTGIPRASVSAVIYRTHKRYFISTPTPGRAKAWYLVQSDILMEDVPFDEPSPGVLPSPPKRIEGVTKRRQD